MKELGKEVFVEQVCRTPLSSMPCRPLCLGELLLHFHLLEGFDDVALFDVVAVGQ